MPTQSQPVSTYASGAQGIASFYQDFYAIDEPQEDAPQITAGQREGPIDLEGLLGIDPMLPILIEAALQSKTHLIIHGPPGTGKTTLARKIAEWLGAEWVLLTATSDWTGHEVIGGYMPDGRGGICFEQGVILRHFDKAVIIDEFNRADIDKAFGPLFSILSGQPVVLPYLSNPAEPDSPRVEILPEPRPAGAVHADNEFAPSEQWRLICTLNTYDKASLFQMSYALARRFAWILLDVPKNLGSFVQEWCALQGWSTHPFWGNGGDKAPVTTIWEAINDVRALGPAPIIDLMKTVHWLSTDAGSADTPIDWRIAALRALGMFVVPQMEGITSEQAIEVGNAINVALGPEGKVAAFEDALSEIRGQLAASAV